MDSHWKRCLIDYLKSLRSSATRESYFTVLSRFFSLHPEPQKITKRDIEAFMHVHFPDPHRTTRGELAAATQNQRVAAISSFYNFASSYIPENETEPLWNKANPTSGIVRGKAEQSPKGLTLDELSRLFDQISNVSLVGIRDKAVLLLVFWSARRRSEISGLRYGDIIDTSFPDEQGAMRKAYVLAFRGKGHKSEEDRQEIPIPALNAVTWYLVASGRYETVRPEDPLFTSIDGKRPLSASTIAKRIHYYAKLAGLRASLHTLRHTAARARYSAGSDVREIQHLLRHRNLSTTDIYLRTLVGTEDPGYKRLGEEYERL